MSEAIPPHRLADFLSTGCSAPNPSPLQLHLLRGWRESTLLSYNSAVRKFKAFLTDSGHLGWNLPASPNDLYEFRFWAGRTEAGPKLQDVMASTVKKYLYGVQAWHTFHDRPYPILAMSRIKVLLRACRTQDVLVPAKAPKSPVRLDHLLLLYHSWVDGSDADKTCLDCVIVAFWGMMRLAEVTYTSRTGQPHWINSILRLDVVQRTPGSTSVTLAVRGAKTAKAGVPQFVLLNAQPNVLCPVAAVRRCLLRTQSPQDALFGFGDDYRINLTHSYLVSRCTKVWVDHGWLGLSGHSFCVGGASFRAALGVPHEDIKRLGRWTSDCYKLYLKEYSATDLSITLSLLRYLNGEETPV